MKKLLSVMLALASLTSTVSLDHASDSEALNGKSGRWADFDESLYNTVVFVSTVKKADVNGVEGPASGSVLLKVSRQGVLAAVRKGAAQAKRHWLDYLHPRGRDHPCGACRGLLQLFQAHWL